MSPEKQKFRSEEFEEFIKEQRKDYDILKLLSFSSEILESKLRSAFHAGWYAREDYNHG